MVNDPLEMKPYYIPSGENNSTEGSTEYKQPAKQPVTIPGMFPASLDAPVSDALLNRLSQFLQKYPKLKPLEPVFGMVASYIMRFRSREDWIQRNEGLKAIERVTQLPPLGSAAMIALLGLAIFKMWWKRQARWITNAIGVVYPALASLRAVEHPQTDDDERWLTYWSLFGLISLADDSISPLFSYYYSLKASFLYWLFGRNGSLTVYRNVIRPYLPLFDSIPSLEDDTQGGISE